MSALLSCTGLSPSVAGFPKTFPLESLNQFRGPNPGMHARRFGLFPFRSPLLWKSHVVFFSSGYLDVSVHRVPDAWLCIHHTTTEVCSAGFPHSEISGSKDICSSPKLFAAYHVFHRLLVPRHPPCALYSLTNHNESGYSTDFIPTCIALQALVLGFVCVHKHSWFFLGCLVSFVLKIFCIFCMRFSRYNAKSYILTCVESLLS